MQQSPGEGGAIKALAHHFYSVVPFHLNICCALTARVSVAALQRCGIEARLLPCQLWYTAPRQNYIVGFYEQERSVSGWWDGHVICATDGWFIDAAVRHLRNGVGVEVPDILGGPRFKLRAQAIARWDRNDTERVWWHHPPPGVDPTPPEESPTLIAGFADALAARMQEHLQVAA
jgi:hypothetical protein